ncbi:hypothetical protein T03_11178 [Trichinella britovi]|uniref:Uncharacterized protein n=1 Tax=Trichinella britovi TaxID=45882 RepID=A0A0V1CVA1_TRIBR|nr:hypothetical protein T03_11178 [Trichinella britovi]
MFHSRPVTRPVVMESCGESLQHHQWVKYKYIHMFSTRFQEIKITKCRSLFISSSECLIMAMVMAARDKFLMKIIRVSYQQNFEMLQKINPNEEDPLKYFMLNSRLRVNHVVVNVTRVCSEDH